MDTDMERLEATKRDKDDIRSNENRNPWLKGIIADVHPSVRIGNNSFVWSFSVICEGVEIGDNCVVGSGVYIGKYTKIGNNVRIQDKAHLTDFMTIEDNVFIGPCAVTMNDRYPVVFNPAYRRESPWFEFGCSIGAGAVILPGVRIGKEAVIGAGSVVTRSVPSNETWMGDAAKKKI